MSLSQPRRQVEWSLATLARLLRPIVRLALGAGVKHAQIEEVLRQTLLTEAVRLLRQRGGNPANVSQLSVITGLHRKELSKRVQQVEEQLPRTDDSLPARVFTRWMQHVSADPAAWRLPVSAPEGVLSFEQIARVETRGNVHARALADEMERLGVLRRVGRDVELNGDGFVPSGDLQALLSFLGDNGRDHLAAAVHNVQTGTPQFLERSVFTHGLSEQQCAAVQERVREQWARLHNEIYEDMVRAEAASTDSPTHRMRVGIYSYFEPVEGDDSPAGPPARTPTD